MPTQDGMPHTVCEGWILTRGGGMVCTYPGQRAINCGADKPLRCSCGKRWFICNDVVVVRMQIGSRLGSRELMRCCCGLCSGQCLSECGVKTQLSHDHHQVCRDRPHYRRTLHRIVGVHERCHRWASASIALSSPEMVGPCSEEPGRLSRGSAAILAASSSSVPGFGNSHVSGASTILLCQRL